MPQGPVNVDVGAVRELIIAGWTGRDQAALEAHIKELEALGVARPHETPAFYPVDASLLTNAASVEVDGRDSTGEVEAVLIAADDGIWVGVGSDHTDRKLEAVSVIGSKRACPKPVSREAWPFREVEPHWDELILRSRAIVNGSTAPYQEGTVSALRNPRELMALYEQRHARKFAPGFAMFCGTLPVTGGLRWADTFVMELEDPVLGRRIAHRYDVRIR